MDVSLNPLPQKSSFVWAVGIEDTFIPQTRPGLRSLDEYELTQHYQQWQTDLDLLADTGAQYVRWGIPWYRVQPEPERWDWRWTDEVLETMVTKKGLVVILDLMHYGTPLWLEGSFIHPDYPQRVAEYAAQVSRRYGALVRYYTPLNEPVVNAELSGQKGVWPPYLKGEAGLVKLLAALARGIIMTTRAVRSEQPDALAVQVEAFWQFTTQDPSLMERVEQQNARKYFSFDLTTGRVDGRYPQLEFFQKHGLTDAALAWFQEQAVQFDVLGVNFYPWSYGQLYRQPNGRIRRRRGKPDGQALSRVLHEAYRRYAMPVMVTETSSPGSVAARENWMDETIATVFQLRRTGNPVVGYTWFPVFTMIDWAYRSGKKPVEDYLLHLGLYDSAFTPDGTLKRYATRLVERYRRHTARVVPEIEE